MIRRINGLSLALLICSGCGTTSPNQMLPTPTGNPRAVFARNGELYVLYDSGEVAALPSTAQYEGQPDVSPDGTRIAVVANEKIYVMNLDGSDRRMLSTTGSVSSVRWHPTLNALLISEGTDRFYEIPDFRVRIFMIRIMDAATGAATTLAEGPGYTEPAVAPDGSLIAFLEPVGSGNSVIHVMNPDGSSQRRITTESTGLFGLRFDWLADGRIAQVHTMTTGSSSAQFLLETLSPAGGSPQLIASRSVNFSWIRGMPSGNAIICFAPGPPHSELQLFSLTDVAATTILGNNGGAADPVPAQ